MASISGGAEPRQHGHEAQPLPCYGEPSPDAPAWRVGAHDPERLLAAHIRELLLDRNRIARLAVNVDPRAADHAIKAAELAGGDILNAPPSLGIDSITLHENRIDIALPAQLRATALRLRSGSGGFPSLARDHVSR